MISISDKTGHEGHFFLRNGNHSIIRYTRYSLALLLIFFFAASLSAQSTDRTAKYRLRVLGMNIGEFTVNQKIAGGDMRIEAITDVEVKIIFTYRVKYIQKSLYREGSLWSSHVQTIKNGKLNSDMRLEKKDESSYLLVEDGDTALVKGNIDYSGSLLYFNEPKQISYLYNERSGEKKTLKAVADHTYVIVEGKEKKTNEYEYENGILARALLIHPLATVHMERSR
ncbi:MAG: DUF6134 family protein [Prolixibacteraceae bacterium]